jgi:hypothetical protein
MTSTTETKPTKSFGDTNTLEPLEDITEDLRARVFSKPSPQPATTESPLTTADKPAATGGTENVASSSTVQSDVEKVTEAIKDVEKPTGLLVATSKVPEPTETKAVEMATEKVSEEEQLTFDENAAVVLQKDKPTTTTDDSAAKTSSLPPTGAKLADGSTTDTTAISKQTVKQIPQVVMPPTKKHAPKPAPIAVTPPTAQKKSAAAKPLVTPTKRTAEPTASDIPDTKGTKIVATPPTPTTPTILSRIPPGSPSPRPFSIERQVADQRKKLEALRQKRLEMARKQEVLDKKMEPYKQRMSEELECLNREMMEEEAAAADDDEQFNASVEMYEELRKGEGKWLGRSVETKRGKSKEFRCLGE